MNERERTVDRRLAALEAKVFGESKGSDGSVSGRRQTHQGPPPYVPPRDNRSGPPAVEPVAPKSAEPVALDPAKPDLNTATAEELSAVNGIGKATAERIIVHRESEPFTSVEDLQRVGGISAAIVAKVRDHVTVGNG